MTESLSALELAKQAGQAYASGDYPTAAGLFAQAAAAQETGNQPLEAAEMRNNQSVALLQAGDARQALDVVQGTAAIFAGAGDVRRHGFALGNEAAALEALNRTEEALRLYQQSAELLKKAGEDQMRAQVMQSISSLQARQGKYIDAVASMQNGLGGVEKPTLKQRILKFLLRFRP